MALNKHSEILAVVAVIDDVALRSQYFGFRIQVCNYHS